MEIKEQNGYAIFKDVPFHLNYKVKDCGASWSKSSHTWKVKLDKVTAKCILDNFKECPDSIKAFLAPDVVIPPLIFNINSTLSGIKLKPNQINGINKAWGHTGFALFWVMGAGKTLSTMAIANARYAIGLIDRLLIICPTSIKGVWMQEYRKYSATSFEIQVMESGYILKNYKEDVFKIFIIGIEAFSQGKAIDEAVKFISSGKCMTVLDESSTIKNYSSIRTKNCLHLASNSLFKLILTGTNITKGIEDLYSQMNFVDPTAIGEPSYICFKSKYLIYGGFEGRKVIGYRNVEELMDKIAPYCDVILKSDMGLPEKQYEKRVVNISDRQMLACRELKRELQTVLNDKDFQVKNVLETMVRVQQIVGGHTPEGEVIKCNNNKIRELISILEEFDGKAIIWARFVPEVNLILNEIQSVFGDDSARKIDGSIEPLERQEVANDFQNCPDFRFIVINQQTGSMGLTLTEATLSIYYSNTFNLGDRLQSEDRNHRIGQHNIVKYVDLVAGNVGIDKTILKAIEHKQNIADFVSSSLRVDDII